MLWSRKTEPTHEKARHIGIDVTASRVRACSLNEGKSRAVLLHDPDEELPLFVALDRRTPEIGRAGVMLCRKTPHAVCSNFLPLLMQDREWRCGRHALTPEGALELALVATRNATAGESEAAAMALPMYLTTAQVARAAAVAARARLPLKGTAIGPLALVADRAAAVLAGKPAAPELQQPNWVVPMRPAATGPGTVAVIDADEFALSAAVVAVERDRVKLLASACWPRFALKAWKDRLLDAVADRCVRLCRRDPRDSADAEQALYEQLDDALEHTRAGHRVSITVRTDRWFQDVVHQPEEFDGYCAALSRGSAEGIRDLIEGTALPLPPRAVWLTHDAGRLSGLARALHTHTAEGTLIEVLPPAAVAHATAALVPRWLSAELPRVHLDATIPLPVAVQAAQEKRASGSPPTHPR